MLKKYVTSLMEVDEALINKLSGFKLGDYEVPVLFVNPTPEFQFEVFPSIVIFRNGVYPDIYSWRWGYGYMYELDLENKAGTKREFPLPYLVYYSLRVYYQYQEDGAILNTYLNTKLHRGSYITINDENYDIFFVSYSNPNAGYKNYGEFEKDGRQLLFDQYLFKVSIDLDTLASESEVTLPDKIVFNSNIK